MVAFSLVLLPAAGEFSNFLLWPFGNYFYYSFFLDFPAVQRKAINLGEVVRWWREIDGDSRALSGCKKKTV
jgi:hypothetical protein